jgi:predicted transcriptional regulator
MKKENPFDYQRVVTSSSFVDREKEIEILLGALLSGESTILYSPRRLGKSSLIQEVFRRIGKERMAIYINLWECFTEADIAENIVNATVNAAYNKLEKAALTLKEYITSAKPFLTVKPDGSIGVRLEFAEQEKTIRESVEMIEKIAKRQSKKAIVAMDEAQTIAEFPGHKLERILRSCIQQQKMVSYVFAGSKQHILEAMVSEKGRPFYGQLRPLTLGLISKEAFTPFIRSGFAKIGITVDDNVILEIYKFAEGNPQRTQQICHWLFSKAKNGARLTSSLVEQVVFDLCADLNKEFEVDLDEIKTKNQRYILRVFATDPVNTPFAQDYVQKHNLGPISTVQTAISGLVEKGILTADYMFVDPLLKTWLQFKFGKRL